jgi:hypothetical protein
VWNTRGCSTKAHPFFALEQLTSSTLLDWRAREAGCCPREREKDEGLDFPGERILCGERFGKGQAGPAQDTSAGLLFHGVSYDPRAPSKRQGGSLS